MAKLANSVAARVGRSVMAHVFSRRPSNRCPKSIVPVVLAAVGEPSGVSDARSLSEPSGRLGGHAARIATGTAPEAARRSASHHQCARLKTAEAGVRLPFRRRLRGPKSPLPDEQLAANVYVADKQAIRLQETGGTTWQMHLILSSWAAGPPEQ